eukprot:6500823-Heterocapsa_arctica.AAC.1
MADSAYFTLGICPSSLKWQHSVGSTPEVLLSRLARLQLSVRQGVHQEGPQKGEKNCEEG